MNDLISRQASIDEIEYEIEMINSALDSITLDFNARERLRQRRGEAREILNSIQQLPSAQPEQSFGEWKQDFTGYVEMLNMPKDDFKGIMEYINEAPFTQPETCEGCKHLGKWENEVEYGYPSPCTRCKRRVEDHYER